MMNPLVATWKTFDNRLNYLKKEKIILALQPRVGNTKRIPRKDITYLYIDRKSFYIKYKNLLGICLT